MVRIAYTFNGDPAALRSSQWKLSDKPQDSIYVNAGAVDEITISETSIREIIKGDEGYFKDIECPLSDIVKTAKTKDFLFVLGKGHVFALKLDSFEEGNYDDATALIEKGLKEKPVSKVEEKIESESHELSKEARAFFKEAARANRQKRSLSEIFRPNIILAAASMIISLLGDLDVMFTGHVLSTPLNLVGNMLLSGILGFYIGYTYTFFMTWFHKQAEGVRVASLILFPVTGAIFSLLTIVGFIPYTIYVLVKK